MAAALARRKGVDDRSADAGGCEHAGRIAVSHLNGRLERRAGLRKTLTYGFAQSRAALQPDEGQADEVGGGNDRAFGQRMLRRQHADRFAGMNHLVGNAGMMRQTEHEAEFGDPALHALDNAFVAPYIEEDPRLLTTAQEG